MKNTMIGHTIQKDTGLRENSSASETDSAASGRVKGTMQKEGKGMHNIHPEHEICIDWYAQTKATKVADGCDLDVSVEEIGGQKGTESCEKKSGCLICGPHNLRCSLVVLHKCTAYCLTLLPWAGVQCVSMRQTQPLNMAFFPSYPACGSGLSNSYTTPHPPHCWASLPLLPSLLHPLG